MKPNQKCFNAYAFHKCILILPDKHIQMPEIEDVFQKKGIMKKRVWSREIKNPDQHYIETSILGSYERPELSTVCLKARQFLCLRTRN